MLVQNRLGTRIKQQPIRGNFKVVETIFDIHVSKSQAPVWHEDASFYDIKDHQGKLIGQFYLATVIARLVSLYGSDPTTGTEDSVEPGSERGTR